MAIATGPLMSMTAHGSLGKTLVFQRKGNRAMVRRHRDTPNPRSDKQVAIQTTMKWLTQQWPSIKATSEPTWLQLAQASRIGPNAAYLRANTERMHINRAPSKSHPGADTGAGPSVPTFTITGGAAYATVVVTPGATVPDWGYAVFMSQSTIATTTFYLIRALLVEDPAHRKITIPHLAPGTWYARVRCFNAIGRFSASSSEKTVTVT